MGEEWRGGDVTRYAGGGQKVLLLREELEKYKNDDDKILLFSDRCSYYIASSFCVILVRLSSYLLRGGYF